MTLENTERYADGALNSNDIPPLPDSKKRTRAGDELQPWCDYATINPCEKIIAGVVDVQSCEADDEEFYKDEWWGWTHERLRFLNNKLGLKALAFALPFAWIATIFITLLLLFLEAMDWLIYTVEASDILITISVLIGSFGYLALSLYLVYLTTNWVMEKGVGTLIKPFEKILQKKVDNSLADGMSELNRVTGQAKFALGKGRYFEAPFIEFDAYVERVIQRGGIFYRLMFVHRYTGKIFNKTWLSGVEASKNEVLALWDMLQRFMDVSQPIPDMPRFEPFRHLDPVTAEYDRKTNRPPRYWRDLDLETWKSGEGAKLATAQARYPWGRRVCKLTPKLGQIDMATYREKRSASASVI
ncbi:hypothetical protein D777_00505 [Marinobacter nitratireducens]|uniref:Uncharacterized protein n=1 Tax=Marinobacter nitratireducens TaxID=1137280 RepID=A0A072N7H6_9GAMM|nr:hypothetical protein [Marinobacter nitratireducens]KEF32943.1 hypothetical protein D777_00505 [Marinobacter nitratireducens]